MGYCISVPQCQFIIKKANEQKALEAIKSLHGKETISDSSGAHFRWVDTATFLDAKTLEAALLAWRWNTESSALEGIVGLEFRGEKFGDDEKLFATLAPFVEAGSFIEFHGEDGDRWKYVFDGKTMKEVRGRFVWEE